MIGGLMATGNLRIQFTDMVDTAVKGVQFELAPMSGSAGVGGATARVAPSAGVSDLTIKNIRCRDGVGTMYEVIAFAPHFKTYGFFQLIEANRDNVAGDDVDFWVKAGDVKDIVAPTFGNLPQPLRDMLDTATMVVEADEDEDLLNLAGEPLYRALGPKRMACLLNIAKKAADPNTTDNCLSLFRGLMISRQDRLFARVDASLAGLLTNSDHFKSAPSTLHKPLPGFVMAGSFKSRDPHANLQVTLMREVLTGLLAADIDIDESSGIEHGFETIRNAVFRNRTNPYLIREFLMAADPIGNTLDPGYRFVF